MCNFPQVFWVWKEGKHWNHQPCSCSKYHLRRLWVYNTLRCATCYTPSKLVPGTFPNQKKLSSNQSVPGSDKFYPSGNDDISHLGKGKSSSKVPLKGDILVTRSVLEGKLNDFTPGEEVSLKAVTVLECSFCTNAMNKRVLSFDAILDPNQNLPWAPKTQNHAKKQRFWPPQNQVRC